MPLELGREREDFEAVASVQRLLILDDIWMSYLDHASREEVERDLPDLERLVGDMQEGLSEVRARAGSAADRLGQLSEAEIEHALSQLIDRNAPGGPELRAGLAESVGELGLRRTLVAACIYVDLEAEEEMGYLGAKIERLRAGSFELGDMRPGTRCALELAGIGMGAAACATALGCISGVGPVVIGLILSWKDSGCRRLVKQMLDRLKRDGVEIA
jgi:hypothetical protein